MMSIAYIVSTTEECNRIATTNQCKNTSKKKCTELIVEPRHGDDDVYDGGTSERTEKGEIGPANKKG